MLMCCPTHRAVQPPSGTHSPCPGHTSSGRTPHPASPAQLFGYQCLPGAWVPTAAEADHHRRCRFKSRKCVPYASSSTGRKSEVGQSAGSGGSRETPIPWTSPVSRAGMGNAQAKGHGRPANSRGLALPRHSGCMNSMSDQIQQLLCKLILLCGPRMMLSISTRPRAGPHPGWTGRLHPWAAGPSSSLKASSVASCPFLLSAVTLTPPLSDRPLLRALLVVGDPPG